MNRPRSLDPPPPVLRYEHKRPGDLHPLRYQAAGPHRQARRTACTGDRRDKITGIGCEYVHVAIDDHSRIAFAAILPDQNHQLSHAASSSMARAFYAALRHPTSSPC